MRVDPNGTAGGTVQPENDRTPAPGVTAFITGQSNPGAGVEANDVDNGVTTLVSPAIDVADLGAARVGYHRWVSTNAGSFSGGRLLVQISSDNGATWQTIESQSSNANAWTRRDFDIAAHVPLTSQMRLRFRAEPNSPASLTVLEAGVGPDLLDRRAARPTICLVMNPLLRRSWLAACGGALLFLTSNAGAADIQDAALSDGRPLWQHVADLVREWGDPLVGEEGMSSVGAVVGATHPRAVSEARKLLPRSPLLLPGVGAQGATPADVARAFTTGAASTLVTASQSVIYAYRDTELDWREAAAQEAHRLQRAVWAASGW